MTMEVYMKNMTVKQAKRLVKDLSDEQLEQAIKETEGEVCEVFMKEYDRRHQEPCNSCRA
jgi:hypothetical protein